MAPIAPVDPAGPGGRDVRRGALLAGIGSTALAAGVALAALLAPLAPAAFHPRPPAAVPAPVAAPVDGAARALCGLAAVAVGLGLTRAALLLAAAVGQRRGAVLAAPHAAPHAAPPHAAAPAHAPGVSVLVAAYNKAAALAPALRALLAQDYRGPLEVLVVDDGSADATGAVAAALAAADPRVRAFRRPNGGKAAALNFALAHARGDVVVTVDATAVCDPGCVRALVAALADPRTGSAAGNARLRTDGSAAAAWRAAGYAARQNLERRAAAAFGMPAVVPGAPYAWRAALARAAGGFARDTLAEEDDLALRLGRAGWNAAYADAAVAWIAPGAPPGAAPRPAWATATLQCVWKHRAALGRRPAALGVVALPAVWLLPLASAALAPAADVAAAGAAADAWLAGGAFGLAHLGLFVGYGAFLVADAAAALIALRFEPGGAGALGWFVAGERFFERWRIGGRRR